MSQNFSFQRVSRFAVILTLIIGGYLTLNYNELENSEMVIDVIKEHEPPILVEDKIIYHKEIKLKEILNERRHFLQQRRQWQW